MDVARQNCRAVFTDLDGTLLGPDQKLCDRNRATLEHLNSLGVTRVVVTGRSLFSCDRVLDDTFPIDLLVTSSGAGIFSFKPKTLLQQFALDNTEMARAIDVLEQMKLDFMVHNAVSVESEVTLQRHYKRYIENCRYILMINSNRKRFSV